jgi:hypothetical protein
LKKSSATPPLLDVEVLVEVLIEDLMDVPFN